MATGKPTLLDVAKFTGTDQIVGLIQENIQARPELEVFPMRTIPGTSYETVLLTGFPTVGFRTANNGSAVTKAEWRRALVQCFILGGAVQMDKAVAEAHFEGQAAFEMMMASTFIEAKLRALGTQIFYGVTADANGFAGLKASTVFGTSNDYGKAYTLNSGGSDATVQSSVYAVRFGTQNVTLIGGRESAMELSEFRTEQILGENSLPMPGRVADLSAWIGLQIGNQNCVRRIANVGQDSETNDTLTDAKLQQLIDLFPTGIRPDAIFMSQRSKSQLQRSRSVTLFGQGTVRPDQPLIAPPPTTYDEIPIIATDSILNTDAVES